MRPQAWLALCAAAGLGAAALRPSSAWGSDLERALASGQPVVVLVAAPDRPLSAATRLAVETAWSELRPRAERVALERAPPRLGACALGLFVLAADGELAARRCGALDASAAQEWLREALAAAASGASSDASRAEAP